MKRLLLILLAVLIVVPLAALAAAHFMVNGDAVRTRIADAVRQATGRELTIAGPVGLAWSLLPTLEAHDLSLANPPGMSRPEMAHLDRLLVRVALLPLLYRRLELRRIVLDAPDILLERDAAGQPNWFFSSPPPPPAATAPTAPSSGPHLQVVVGTVEVANARIGWRLGRDAGQVTAPLLAYRPQQGAVSGQLVHNGVPLALSGTAGPVVGGVAAWPLDLQLVGGGVAATVTGSTAQAAIAVEIPQLAAASALAGRALPEISLVQLAATLAQSGIRDVRLQAGAADLGGGLRLVRFGASAATPDQPVTATAELTLGTLPIALSGSVSSLRALQGPAPIPIQLQAAADGATASGSGALADLRGHRLTLALSAHVPDLAGLGARAGLALPGLRDATLQTGLALSPDGLTLHDLKLDSAQGDLAGELALALRPRPSLQGTLAARRLDLDAWTALPPASAPAGPGPAPAPGPAAAPAPRPDRVIPDITLPFAALRRADAELHLTVGEASWRGVLYRAVEAGLSLQQGRLRLDPVRLQTPGGTAQGRLEADAAAQPPTLAVTVQAPGLAAGPTLALLGAPSGGPGTLDLNLQLRGSGETLRALAATLDGHLGLALVDGEIENRWLADLLGETLRAANLPLDRSGSSRVRCAAVRADATDGQVRLSAFALDTSKLRLDGSGGLDLARETLDLHLRPLLRLGTALSVPVRVAGPWRSAKVVLDPGAIASGRVGITIGGPAAPDTCAPALALARDGRAGPAPPPPAPVRAAKPADLLRELFR